MLMMRFPSAFALHSTRQIRHPWNFQHKFAAANLLGEVLGTSRFGRPFNQLTLVRKADRSLSLCP